MIRFDEFDHLPALPADIDEVNATAQAVFTFGQIVPILFFCWLAHRYSRQYGTYLPWMFLIGGLLMCVNEGLVDHNGRVWFHTEGQWTAFIDYGVHLPVWLVLAYIWFFGGRAMVIWHLIENGAAKDPRWIYRHWGVVIAIDIVLENIALYLGLFLYYGEQPFQIGKFPLWWAAINATTPIVLAVVITVLRPYLTGWRVAWVILLAPCVAAAVNAGLGWITWSAINQTQLPAAVVWAAGAVTVGIAVGLLHLSRGVLVQADRLGLIAIDGSRAPQAIATRDLEDARTDRAPEPA